MAAVRISGVAYQPHVALTHPQLLGGSLVLRIPEYVKSPDGSANCCPGQVVWEQVAGEAHLRYRWDEAEAAKRKWATDFCGQVRAGEDAVAFEVTMRNAGAVPQPWGVFLFCLQAGACSVFQDYDGVRTFVRLADRWATVNQMQAGVFADHRMCVYPVGDGGVAHNLMAKVGTDGQWVLAMAIDRPGWVSCNHQQWPSCIHANPVWGDLPAGTCADPGTSGSALPPGASVTCHGKVYLCRGSLDAVYERYASDFHRA